MSETTLLIIVLISGFAVLFFAVLAVGYVVILRMVLPTISQPQHRGNAELYIGQMARREVEEAKRQRDEAVRKRDEYYKMIEGWGYDPDTGDYIPVRRGNNVRASLFEMMIDHLGEDDIITIFFHLNIDQEMLKDGTKGQLAQSLLESVEKSGRQRELSVALVKLNSAVDWPQYW